MTGVCARARRLRRDGDRGAASAFVVAISVALLLVGGLVVDGGRTLNARAAAADDAEQAARAGADRIDEATLRASGLVVVDRVAAGRAASDYCATRGYGGGRCDVQIAGNAVTVTTTTTVRAAILSIVPGLGSFTVDASATAEPVQGIDGPLVP